MELNQILEKLDGLYAQGNLPEAEKKLEEWLSEALDAGNLGIALTLYNEMEGLYRTTGRAGKAVAVSDKALELIEKMGLRGTIHHGTTLLNGATASRMAGDSERALKMYHQAAEIFRKEGYEKSYQMAALYNNISQIYQEQEKHEKALEFLGDALKLMENMEGGEAETATTRVNMALSLMELDRLDEARQAMGEALSYYTSSAGAGDGHFGSALSAAGELSWRCGDAAQAAAFLEEALRVTRERFGENDACRVIRANLEYIRGSEAFGGGGCGGCSCGDSCGDSCKDGCGDGCSCGDSCGDVCACGDGCGC